MVSEGAKDWRCGVEPCTRELVSQLDLKGAVLAEAAHARSLLPPEPGWADLSKNASSVARWLGNQLRSGWVPAPEQVIAVRKAGHGIRPVPIWSAPDRIIYRALVNLLSVDDAPLDRSAKRYLDFRSGPYTYSQALIAAEPTTANNFLTQIFASPFQYVVASDIAAFYQYIDHTILASELISRGHDNDAVSALFQLLQEAQGKRYGIPQLLGASDYLSEVYIDRVERSMLRNGHFVWRYNDDFRIGCTNYSAALNAIEDLASTARDNGLVLSEHKTVTYGYVKYVIDQLGLQISEDQTVIAPDEVEDIVSDYTEDFGAEDLDAAVAVVTSALPGAEEPGIDLKETSTLQIRLLRRALGAMAANDRPDALESIKVFIDFVPSLTPTVARYCAKVAANSDEAKTLALEVIDSILNYSSLNEWQKLWMVHLVTEVNALDPLHGLAPEDRRKWVEDVARHSSSAVARAAAWTALAEAGLVRAQSLARQMDEAPTCLYVYYLTGIRALCQLTQDPDDLKVLESLARESIFNRSVLK
jgi:hypothetical protein